ncbi:GPI-linked NAD(P)(+)--arginine ADP-ribosyltransferase 1 [Phaethornis superciliosus]
MAPSPVLGLVLLSGTLGALSPPCRRNIYPGEEVTLDMAPNSFDDQYRGCGSAMERELRALNHSEFTKNNLFARAWAEATTEWYSRMEIVPKVSSTLPLELAVAIMAYTIECPLYQKFNDATRNAGRSRRDYMKDFHFKVLHFLLTRALRLLRDSQRPQKCFCVYRGVPDVRFTSRPGQRVRFGQFTSSSLQKDKAQSFGEKTSFSIQTCWGVPIKDFSFFPEEEEVLIPPYETFNVTGVTRSGHKTFIRLRSQDTSSKYNCEFLKEQQCQSLPCASSSGSTWDPPQLWGLLLAVPILAAIRDP